MSRYRSSSRRKPAKEPIPEVFADLADPRAAAIAVPVNLAGVEKDLEQTSASSTVEVAYHTALNWGKKHENEDRTMQSDVPPQQGGSRLGFSTVGVLDGHDTDMASDAVSKMLPGIIAKHLQAGENIEEAYERTMAECEDALRRNVSTAGTCVLSCLIAGRFIWCANLGDCRAALVMLEVPDSDSAAESPAKASSLCWMSVDHKASCPNEVRRIQGAGGRVNNGRVEGLEPSRTLGDFDVKIQVPPGVISIKPEVRCYAMGENGLPAQGLLVCATDGVWDAISGQDICDLIHARKELVKTQLSALHGEAGKVDTRPLSDLAEDLVQFAIARGSRDDCTAVTSLISVNPMRC